MAPTDRTLDALAEGMAEETISRSQVIKLAGATLLGSALSLFVADDASARRGRSTSLQDLRRRCERRGNDKVFCTDGGKNAKRSKCCDRETTTRSRCQKGQCGGRARDRDDDTDIPIPIPGF
jgi:hypothetical protein